MRIVGVTGGIGSGKSTVARLLGARGARVQDADRVVRELYAGGELPAAIEAAFGPGMLDEAGAVDRAALARVAFAGEENRKALEEMVHPAVRRTILERIEAWREEGFDGVAVIDAALLIEANSPYPLDSLVVVVADPERRIERLAGRGVPEDEARRRMAAQLSDEEKARHADHVIENSGSLEDLERAVEALWRRWEAEDGSGGTLPPSAASG